MWKCLTDSKDMKYIGFSNSNASYVFTSIETTKVIKSTTKTLSYRLLIYFIALILLYCANTASKIRFAHMLTRCCITLPGLENTTNEIFLFYNCVTNAAVIIADKLFVIFRSSFTWFGEPLQFFKLIKSCHLQHW